jgi:hypothetical protein
MRALLFLVLLLTLGAMAGCGGGSASPSGGGTWSGTRTTQYVLRGDAPSQFTGPDAADELILAQVKQALEDRTYNLDLYEIENASGVAQEMKLHSADVLSSLFAGDTEAYQIPGQVIPGAVDTALNLNIVVPTYAWETLNLKGTFSTNTVNALVTKLHPLRDRNVVGGTAVVIDWEITGLNGSRLVELECKQTTWMYAVSKLIQ